MDIMGIGVSASYNKQFDKDTTFDFLRHFVFKKADANIFYSDYLLKSISTKLPAGVTIYSTQHNIRVIQ